MKYLVSFVLFCHGLCMSAQVPTYIAEGFSAGSPGWYFITTLQFQGSNNTLAQAVILDGAGDIVFRQRIPNASNFRVWPDGRMSYAARGKHLLMDATFTLIDSISCANGVLNDLHEFRILPNGNYLLLGAENRTMDLSGYQVFQNGTVAGSPVAVVKSAIIQELDADRNLLWEWNALDHFNFLDTDVTRLNNPNVVDWTHANAVELDADGNILLSSRHFNEITKIDRSTGAVIWRMGGARNEFTFVDDPGFFLQHDIRRLPNGNITLFDNSKPGAHPGRGVEYTIDEEALTATPVWSAVYDEGAYSRAMGSMQRLANGNSLIGWGALTPDNAMFTVQDPDGERVARLTFLDTSVTYRAYYFEELPFAIDRPMITCGAVGEAFELTATGTGDIYTWSTGASGSSITIGALDTVYVEVPVGSGGFLRSAPFTPDVDCVGTSIEEAPDNSFALYPSPAATMVHLQMKNATGVVEVELVDALGKVLVTSTLIGDRATIPVHALRPGVYFVHVAGRVQRFVKD